MGLKRIWYAHYRVEINTVINLLLSRFERKNLGNQNAHQETQKFMRLGDNLFA